MTKAQPDADALGHGPVTIAAMYGDAVYADRSASRAYLRLRRRIFARWTTSSRLMTCKSGSWQKVCCEKRFW
jgi:hypothetical protein